MAVTPVVPAAAPAAPAAQAKPSAAAPVKPNPVGAAPAHPGNSAGTPKPEGTTPPPAPSRFTRKEKIDGKEVELSASEDELWAAYRKGSTLDRRFEENARSRREVEAQRAQVEEQQAALKDPEKLLEIFMRNNPDADPVEVMSAILRKRLEEDELLQDPNIRERRRLERENAEYKSKEQKAEEERVQAEFKQAEHAEIERLSESFHAALELSQLPKNDLTLELMAKAEHANRTQGLNLTPAQLASATRKGALSLIEALTAGPDVTDDQVLEMFPTLAKRVHKAIVARYQKRQTTVQQPTRDVTPRERRPAEGEAPKQRLVSSAEEHKLFGQKGLRTL